MQRSQTENDNISRWVVKKMCNRVVERGSIKLKKSEDEGLGGRKKIEIKNKLELKR